MYIFCDPKSILYQEEIVVAAAYAHKTKCCKVLQTADNQVKRKKIEKSWEKIRRPHSRCCTFAL